MNCACGHDPATQHPEGACICCLCPEPHDEVRMVPTLLNGRWPLLLPSHRAYRREWTTPPYWEPERLAAMADVIGPSDVVYDIGAEEADMTAIWALLGADVVAVEANYDVWPNIRAIFEANNLTERVHGWFVGFAGEELRDRPAWDGEHVSGEARWGDEQAVRNWPSCAYRPLIGDHNFMNLNERPDCPVITIDRLAELHGPPTVITIDTEGSELTVLRGAYRTLKEHRPRVFVSVHQDHPWVDLAYPGDDGEALAAYMRSVGYYGKDLALDHELHQVWTHPEGG